MFKKILINEDIDSLSLGLKTVLEKLYSIEIQQAKYCDEAYNKIRKAVLDQEPFDLLISDLSFKPDHRDTKLASGEALIEKLQETHPQLKVIAYSIEDRKYRIKSLFDDLHICGYVCKGRDSSDEIIKAINQLATGEKRYISPSLSHILLDNSVLEIDEHDIDIVKHLSSGLSNEEISGEFKKQQKSATSVSSIEKRINKLKIYFKARNTNHLISIAKDMGLI